MSSFLEFMARTRQKTARRGIITAIFPNDGVSVVQYPDGGNDRCSGVGFNIGATVVVSDGAIIATAAPLVVTEITI
jgi:hypothetical protein